MTTSQPAQEITWDLVLKRNPRERMKADKHPLDVLKEIPDFIKSGYESVPEEDLVRLQWYGLYHDKPRVGTFMMRIKIANGILTPKKLRTIGEISQKFGKGFGELATRQNIQLHNLRLEDLPEVFDILDKGGLTTISGCGDTVRNITGCAVAGVDTEELFDTSSAVLEAAKFFYAHRDYTMLPRKHKITIAACPYQCNAPEMHDMALIGVAKGPKYCTGCGATRMSDNRYCVECGSLYRGDMSLGYTVRVGGGLSTAPRISKHLPVFVPRGEEITFLRAMIDVWRENPKYRVSFAKARFKFMIDDIGVEKFRELVEERLGHRLADFPECPKPKGQNFHLGVNPQRQKDLSYIGFPVLAGLMTGEQMIRIADLAEEHSAEIRIMRQQNFVVTNVPSGAVQEVIDEVEKIGYTLKTSRLKGISTACTGQPFCNYAVGTTKPRMIELVNHLENVFGEINDLQICLDGCPHACGHHWVGDIGLQGTTIRTPDGKLHEAFDIILGGGLGEKATIGKAIMRRVPVDQFKEHVERLYRSYREKKKDSEKFQEFCLSHKPEELVAMMTGNGVAAASQPSHN